MTPLDRLSPEDARILRLEEGTIRGHTGKVIVAGSEPVPEPPMDRLRAHVEQRLERFPRLRRRLAPTPLGLADPVWVPDSDFDITRHVTPAWQDRPLDPTALRVVVADLMTQRLQRDRPLWRVDVVGPLEGGGFALVLRIHHCLADGMTAIRIVSEVLLDSEPVPTPPSPEAGDAPGPEALLALAVRDRAVGAVAGAGRGARAIVSPGAWKETALTAWRLPGMLRRELLPQGAGSPLEVPAGRHRSVAFVSRPLADLKRVAHSLPGGVTVNDVVLAATGGGLRRWLEREGAPVDDLRAKVPVSLHRPGEDAAASANRDSFMVVGLALDRPDPVERLLAISAETKQRKQRHDAEELDAVFRDIAHLSRPLERFVQRWTVRSRVFAINVSNVPGPTGPLSLLGAPVRELYSLAEIANRHALRVSVISAGGGLGFAFCADPDAVAGLEDIAAGVGRELDELLSRV